MLSGRRSLTKAKSLGSPLPRIPELADLHDGQFRYRFFSAQTTVIAGIPGAQKSGLVTWLLSQWNLPTLFFSADTDQKTAIARLTAAVTGDEVNEVRKAIDTGNEAYYEDVVAESRVQWVFTPEPDINDVENQLAAWVEAWDSWPSIIVLDNLLDVIPPSGDSEHAGYKAVLLECKKLSRKTGAAIFVLHHMSEAEDSDARKVKPPARKRLMGKAAQTPENILSIALINDGQEMLICPVKHRNGKGDDRAERFERLRVHPERNQFSRWVPLDDEVNRAIQEYWEDVK